MITFDHVETSNTPVDLADTNSMFLERRYPNGNWLFVYIIYDLSPGLTLHIAAWFGFVFGFSLAWYWFLCLVVSCCEGVAALPGALYV